MKCSAEYPQALVTPFFWDHLAAGDNGKSAWPPRIHSAHFYTSVFAINWLPKIFVYFFNLSKTRIECGCHTEISQRFVIQRIDVDTARGSASSNLLLGTQHTGKHPFDDHCITKCFATLIELPTHVPIRNRTCACIFRTNFKRRSRLHRL